MNFRLSSICGSPPARVCLDVAMPLRRKAQPSTRSTRRGPNRTPSPSLGLVSRASRGAVDGLGCPRRGLMICGPPARRASRVRWGHHHFPTIVSMRIERAVEVVRAAAALAVTFPVSGTGLRADKPAEPIRRPGGVAQPGIVAPQGVSCRMRAAPRSLNARAPGRRTTTRPLKMATRT